METWYEYRLVWADHPWIVVIPVLGVLFILGAIVGMITAGPMSVLFIPGLAALFIHHLIVQKASDTPPR